MDDFISIKYNQILPFYRYNYIFANPSIGKMPIPKKRSAKNIGKINNNQLVGLKMLALGRLKSIYDICFLREAANLRSAPGGRHSSYVTDVYAIKNIFIESS